MRNEPLEQPEILDFRATITLCACSILLSVFEFQGQDLSNLHMSHLAWPQEPWRLFTSCLLHGGLLHLAFNIYWTFKFGAILEPTFGLLATIGMFILFGMTSSAAQWAFSGGGVGLSGIVYGLFGLLWALHRYQPGYRAVIDEGVVKLFVGWFFVCILLTELNIMPIANLAHGAGAVVGVLLGMSVTTLGMKRWQAGSILATLVLLIGLASTVGRPFVNLSDARVRELNMDAYFLLTDEEYEPSIPLLKRAVEIDDENVMAWHNLGVANQRLGNNSAAREAFERAEELERQQPKQADSEAGGGLFGLPGAGE